MITEFLEGIEIPDLLKSEKNVLEIINKYLFSLILAHNKNIVFGDRWGYNTIINKEGNIINFDFDIKLNTEDSKEFEISQAVYYSLFFSKENKSVLGYLQEFLKREDLNYIYDKNMITKYLEGHSQYFKGTIYGGIEREICKLTSIEKNE